MRGRRGTRPRGAGDDRGERSARQSCPDPNSLQVASGSCAREPKSQVPSLITNYWLARGAESMVGERRNFCDIRKKKCSAGKDFRGSLIPLLSCPVGEEEEKLSCFSEIERREGY